MLEGLLFDHQELEDRAPFGAELRPERADHTQ